MFSRSSSVLQEDEKYHYFAYGSNLLLERLSYSVAKPILKCVAELKVY